jgi:hypothetical protein
MTQLQQGLTTGGMGSDRHFAQQQSSGPNVRFGSKADMCSAKGHVRFTPKSDRDCVFRHVRYGPIALPLALRHSFAVMPRPGGRKPSLQRRRFGNVVIQSSRHPHHEQR